MGKIDNSNYGEFNSIFLGLCIAISVLIVILSII